MEIVDSISGSETDSKSLMEKWQRVVLERPDLEVDANINSSGDDLDVDLDDENKGKKFMERPPLAHSTKNQFQTKVKKLLFKESQKKKSNQ